MRSTHRIQPQRPTDVGNIAPTQMEPRNPDSPAVLPNPSARAEWLLASLIDRALNYGAWAPPLHGGDGDDDADTRTDTTIPDDDNEDVASLTSQHSTSLQQSNFQSCRLAPQGCLLSDVSVRPGA